MARLRAAIVGLGRVGMLFDADALRTRVWTHFSAYERLGDRFDLAAVCDPDPERRALALEREPGLSAYATLEELLEDRAIAVVSLCTPPELHAPQLAACAGRVRAVVCEKPLGTDVEEAREALAACAAAGTLVVVNYYKRYETPVLEAADLLRSGSLGEVRAASAAYSGGLDAVGSHAVDLLGFLLGPLDVVHALHGTSGTGAVLRFADDRLAVLSAVGPREDLVFEVDVLAAEGRLRLLENCRVLEVSRFEESARYGGYRELGAPDRRVPQEGEPFLSLFEELADVLGGAAVVSAADAASALRTQEVLSLLDLGHARV